MKGLSVTQKTETKQTLRSRYDNIENQNFTHVLKNENYVKIVEKKKFSM